MRLLVITAFYPPHHMGGYELRCKDVLNGLINKGHEIIILTTACPKRSCSLHTAETSIYRNLHQHNTTTNVPSQIMHDNFDLRFIEKVIRATSPDLIYLWHIQNLSPAILPYFSAQSIPIVHDEGGNGMIYLAWVSRRGLYFFKNDHDPWVKKVLKGFLLRTAKLISQNRITPDWHWPEQMHIYFNSHSARQFSLDKGALVEASDVIQSGIDLAKFPFHPRERISQPVQIILPSRIKPEKGIWDGIRLIQILNEKNIPAHLILLGAIQSQHYFANIKSKVQALGFGENVSHQEMVSQDVLSQVYQQADICFFPSYFKTGLSRVPMEAMACGAVVISYGYEGSREIIREESQGIIVEEGDFQGAASWIEKFINDPSIYKTIVSNARKHIESNFCLDKYIDSIESYLFSCLAGV